MNNSLRFICVLILMTMAGGDATSSSVSASSIAHVAGIWAGTAFSRGIQGDPCNSYAIDSVKPDSSDEAFILGHGSSAEEPLVGLWRLQRQEIDGNATDFEPPLALQISQAHDRLRFAFSVPLSDEYVETTTFTLRLDGSCADIMDRTHHKVGTIQMTRSEPGQYLLTMTGPNKPDAQGKLTISGDGNTLISESDARQSGRSVHSTQVFIRN